MLAAIFEQRIDTMTAQLFQSACLQGFGLYCAMFADEFYGARTWFKFAIMGISNYYDNSQQKALQKKSVSFCRMVVCYKVQMPVITLLPINVVKQM